MKCARIILKALLAVLASLIITGCGSSGSSDNNDPPPNPIDYRFWQGGLSTNFYYIVNIYGDRAVKVTGRPFMVEKFNNITLQILDIEFGMSEVTQVAIPNANNFAAPLEPYINATSIDYNSKFNLQGNVVLLSTWNTGSGKSSITNGVQNFSFKEGSSPGGVGYNEQWSFTYTSGLMTGDVKNIDTTYFLGIDSDTWAFKLNLL